MVVVNLVSKGLGGVLFTDAYILRCTFKLGGHCGGGSWAFYLLARQA
jgi:hypothetical protein